MSNMLDSLARFSTSQLRTHLLSLYELRGRAPVAATDGVDVAIDRTRLVLQWRRAAGRRPAWGRL